MLSYDQLSTHARASAKPLLACAGAGYSSLVAAGIFNRSAEGPCLAGNGNRGGAGVLDGRVVSRQVTGDPDEFNLVNGRVGALNNRDRLAGVRIYVLPIHVLFGCSVLTGRQRKPIVLSLERNFTGDGRRV